MTSDDPTAPVKVLIVDDQLMIRIGLRAILESSSSIAVVDDVADGLLALAAVQRDEIDVVVMDIRMPGIDGVEATRRIRALDPPSPVKIVVLTTFDDDENVFDALRAGANGFLSKGVGPAELVAGVLDVAGGGGVLSAKAASALIDQVAETKAPVVDGALAQRFRQLTPRELSVVLAAAQGKDNQQIAGELFVSPFTVKTHVARAMSKVGARDRTQMVAFAYQAGLMG